jgi:hypothetical protein
MVKGSFNCLVVGLVSSYSDHRPMSVTRQLCNIDEIETGEGQPGNEDHIKLE